LLSSNIFSSIQRKLVAFPNSIAYLAVHSETNTQREFPHRASWESPSSFTPSGDHLVSGTLSQELQLSWGLGGTGFYIKSVEQRKL
jgi:hypothetical protein